jgi:hypothetical protein
MASEDSDLLASRLATAAAGTAFSLGAIAGLFVNYGIAIGFGIGAVICFAAAHYFPELTKMRIRSPITGEQAQQRTYWQTFAFISYASLGVSVFLALIIGGAFYIQDLRDRISHESRRLTPQQKTRLSAALQLGPNDKLSLQINSIPNCEDCEDLAQDLRDSFSEIQGWSVSGGVLIFPYPPSLRTGVHLSVGADYNPVLSKRILSAFDSANIPITVTSPEKLAGGMFAVILVGKRLP